MLIRDFPSQNIWELIPFDLFFGPREEKIGEVFSLGFFPVGVVLDYFQSFNDVRLFFIVFEVALCVFDLPAKVVPLATRVLGPWTTGEAGRSPEAMVLSSRVLVAGSPVSCVA
jgi:hypothetical protein